MNLAVIGALVANIKPITWFFSDPLSVRKLKVAIHEWEGTPWAYFKSEKQKGADCVGLILGVFRDCGLYLEQPPRYKAAWVVDDPYSDPIRKYLRRFPTLWYQIHESVELLPGDLVLYHYQEVPFAHVALYCGNDTAFHSTAYQNISGARITPLDIGSDYRRTRYAYRAAKEF